MIKMFSALKAREQAASELQQAKGRSEQLYFAGSSRLFPDTIAVCICRIQEMVLVTDTYMFCFLFFALIRMIYLLRKQLNPHKKRKKRRKTWNPAYLMITLIFLLT